jgi:hypothetical protein
MSLCPRKKTRSRSIANPTISQEFTQKSVSEARRIQTDAHRPEKRSQTCFAFAFVTFIRRMKIRLSHSRYRLALPAALSTFRLGAQLSIIETNSTYTIDFDNTIFGRQQLARWAGTGLRTWRFNQPRTFRFQWPGQAPA